MNNAFQNINQVINLKYWHNDCLANRTLDTVFGAKRRYILVSQSWTSAQAVQQTPLSLEV